jgi:uncharacterized membrane protein required for colicin V production
MMLNIFVLVIVALVVSMTLSEGLWGNALSMINAIFAAFIATNLFEPAADFMDGQAPSLTYFWDFIMMWLIFAFTFGILRTITDQISPTRVRFKLPVEASGTILFGLLTGWVVVCFFMFSLHTAPLVRNHFGKAFGSAPDASNFFLDPDRLWLGFMQSRSKGALSTSEPNVFDPQSEFILKYGERRQRFSELSGLTVDSRRRPGLR